MTPPPTRNPVDPKAEREEIERLREARRLEKLAKRQLRDTEERLGPVQVRGQRPVNPRPGQLIFDRSERRHLRFNPDAKAWEDVEQHRPCGHWIRKGDPVEAHTHDCVGDVTPTVVFQCARCVSRYRVERQNVNAFKFRYRGECPTCSTPWPEDQPRDAIDKDFRQ